MKLFIILLAVTWSNAAKLDNTYLPPSRSQNSGGSGSFLQTPLGSGQGFAGNGNSFGLTNDGFRQNGNGFQNGNSYNEYNNFGPLESPERPQAAFERNAAIVRLDSQNDGETYSYAYETENGIYAEENGVAVNGVEAQGGYSYTGDDGQVYSVRYTADQNGFVPQGDHLPTPPPVPEEILKALEQNARDEAAGIYDDGSYNEGKYSDDEQQYGTNNYNNNRNAFNDQNNQDDSVVTNALFRQSANSFINGNRGSGPSSQAYLPPGRGNDQKSFNNGNTRPINGNSQRANQRATQYLPPFAGQRSSNNGNTARSGSRFSSQAYLPPFSGQRDSSHFGNGNSNLGLEQATKAYLPPQRSSNGGFGSRNRPGFSARNGYRY